MQVSDTTRVLQGLDIWTLYLASDAKSFDFDAPEYQTWKRWRDANPDIADNVKDAAQSAFMRGFDKAAQV